MCLDAVGAGVGSQARHGGLLLLAARLKPSAAGVHLDAELVVQLRAQGRRTQDQAGLQLAGLGVKAGVQDPGVGAAGAVRELGLGLEQHDVHAAARERVGDSAADDPAADDRDLGVGGSHRRRDSTGRVAPGKGSQASPAAARNL